MRTKDEQKRKALFEATVKLVNEIGFAASSVSKIAKEANVSPSTLYVFFKNKEDLLVSTYVNIKMELSRAILNGFDDSLPIRDILRNVWFSSFKYISSNLEYYQFVEQFANSPYSELVDREALEENFIPLIEVLHRGIEHKIIKDVDRNLLVAFLFHPLSFLANPRLCHDWQLNTQKLETAFNMAWDAIKL
jgi:AcrR family transcriptional regulator